MNRQTTIALGMIALGLAGCHRGGSDAEKTISKGQVVATVDGKEITVYEIKAELDGVDIPSNVPRKQVEQAALQQIINRKILADIARERGLDNSPDFLIQQHRAADMTLVRLLQQSVAQKLGPPSRDAAVSYMNANPDQFAQRKIYTLDQIQFVPPNQTYPASLQPLNTLDQVEAKLKADNIQYRRGGAALDALSAPAEMLPKLAALPPGEVFIVPTKDVLTANVITGTKVDPFSGDRAIAFATNVLQAKRLQQAETSDLKAKVDAARAKVTYQAGYAPPPKPAAAKPAAGAPAPAPAAGPAPAPKPVG